MTQEPKPVLKREDDNIRIEAMTASGAEALGQIDEETFRRMGEYPRALALAIQNDLVAMTPAVLDGRQVMVIGLSEPGTEKDPKGVLAGPVFILVDADIEERLDFRWPADG